MIIQANEGGKDNMTYLNGQKNMQRNSGLL
jgi:hypothetical protein